ncbi:hypothetical protein [Mesorhizobium sp. WSM4884]|uniref:hypothetical protein n=1 Tax=Mesorhizobium sp. WSM4884 TaxID=3038542 RepID=UPI00241799E8|nr:hypothetical protein [Mesorhizobium sp. WSM4884]MDG4879733.1 hypothetical protein [Mesorhizobium sp. WSM4884]
MAATNASIQTEPLQCAAGGQAAFLSHSGMPVFDTVLTMSMGKRLADFSVGGAAAPMTYALASQTLG